VKRHGILVVTLWCALLALCSIQPALAQTATSDQTQNLNNDQAFNQQGGINSITLPSSVPLRGFPIPGESPLPPSLPIPPHFAPPVTDGNFGALVTLLAYKDQYTMADAQALMHKKGRMRIITNCFIPETGRRVSGFLRILPEPKDKTAFKRAYEVIGIGNYKSWHSNSISEQVLGLAILEGLKIGADAMLFQEGAALIQCSRGWSIGLFNSLSTSNSGSGEGYGNVGVGGLGFGRGQSGYESKPWLRVQFFKSLQTAALPARPRKPNEVGKKPEDDKIYTYEEALKKPAKEITPEEALILRQQAPSAPPPPSRRRD